jgi:anti-sigma regulatory factor (Ser/Thr protein kinase)
VDRETAVYHIRDEGPGFDTSIMERPIDPEALMMPSGRGLLLIRMFMDEVQFSPSGNEILMTKRSADAAS